MPLCSIGCGPVFYWTQVGYGGGEWGGGFLTKNGPDADYCTKEGLINTMLLFPYCFEWHSAKSRFEDSNFSGKTGRPLEICKNTLLNLLKSFKFLNKLIFQDFHRFPFPLLIDFLLCTLFSRNIISCGRYINFQTVFGMMTKKIYCQEKSLKLNFRRESFQKNSFEKHFIFSSPTFKQIKKFWRTKCQTKWTSDLSTSNIRFIL